MADGIEREPMGGEEDATTPPFTTRRNILDPADIGVSVMTSVVFNKLLGYGTKGADGKDGKDGEKGEDGVDGESIVGPAGAPALSRALRVRARRDFTTLDIPAGGEFLFAPVEEVDVLGEYDPVTGVFVVKRAGLLDVCFRVNGHRSGSDYGMSIAVYKNGGPMTYTGMQFPVVSVAASFPGGMPINVEVGDVIHVGLSTKPTGAWSGKLRTALEFWETGYASVEEGLHAVALPVVRHAPFTDGYLCEAYRQYTSQPSLDFQLLLAAGSTGAKVPLTNPWYVTGDCFDRELGEFVIPEDGDYVVELVWNLVMSNMTFSAQICPTVQRKGVVYIESGLGNDLSVTSGKWTSFTSVDILPRLCVGDRVSWRNRNATTASMSGTMASRTMVRIRKLPREGTVPYNPAWSV